MLHVFLSCNLKKFVAESRKRFNFSCNLKKKAVRGVVGGGGGGSRTALIYSVKNYKSRAATCNVFFGGETSCINNCYLSQHLKESLQKVAKQ